MALYTLYPCKPDGTSETFVTFELNDDAEAFLRALSILDQHPSAESVAIWWGERKVAVRTRVDGGLATLLMGEPPREVRADRGL